MILFIISFALQTSISFNDVMNPLRWHSASYSAINSDGGNTSGLMSNTAHKSRGSSYLHAIRSDQEDWNIF